MTDFDRFWSAFPRKVGKLAAKKAYEKARKGGATAAELLDGVALYIQHKPGYADFCHPSSWLNAGRWLDEWGHPEQETVRLDWASECREMHNGECGLSQRAHHQRKQMDEFRAKASA